MGLISVLHKKSNAVCRPRRATRRSDAADGKEKAVGRFKCAEQSPAKENVFEDCHHAAGGNGGCSRASRGRSGVPGKDSTTESRYPPARMEVSFGPCLWKYILLQCPHAENDVAKTCARDVHTNCLWGRASGNGREPPKSVRSQNRAPIS